MKRTINASIPIEDIPSWAYNRNLLCKEWISEAEAISMLPLPREIEEMQKVNPTTGFPLTCMYMDCKEMIHNSSNENNSSLQQLMEKMEGKNLPIAIMGQYLKQAVYHTIPTLTSRVQHLENEISISKQRIQLLKKPTHSLTSDDNMSTQHTTIDLKEITIFVHSLTHTHSDSLTQMIDLFKSSCQSTTETALFPLLSHSLTQLKSFDELRSFVRELWTLDSFFTQKCASEDVSEQIISLNAVMKSIMKSFFEKYSVAMIFSNNEFSSMNSRLSSSDQQKKGFVDTRIGELNTIVEKNTILLNQAKEEIALVRASMKKNAGEIHRMVSQIFPFCTFSMLLNNVAYPI